MTYRYTSAMPDFEKIRLMTTEKPYFRINSKKLEKQKGKISAVVDFPHQPFPDRGTQAIAEIKEDDLGFSKN
jgi:hypothetical protein